MSTKKHSAREAELARLRMAYARACYSGKDLGRIRDLYASEKAVYEVIKVLDAYPDACEAICDHLVRVFEGRKFWQAAK